MAKRAQYFDVVIDEVGNALDGIEATVYEADGVTEASIYTSRTVSTPEDNPFTTDASGIFTFYTDAGDYKIVYHDTELPARVDDRTIWFNSVSGDIVDGGIDRAQLPRGTEFGIYMFDDDGIPDAVTLSGPVDLSALGIPGATSIGSYTGEQSGAETNGTNTFNSVGGCSFTPVSGLFKIWAKGVVWDSQGDGGIATLEMTYGFTVTDTSTVTLDSAFGPTQKRSFALQAEVASNGSDIIQIGHRIATAGSAVVNVSNCKIDAIRVG